MICKALSFALLVLVCLSGVTALRPAWHQVKGYSFAQYVVDFEKKYENPQEYAMREQIFNAKMQEVIAHNEDNTGRFTYKKGINHLSDHSVEEFKSMLGYKKSLAYRMKSQPSRGKPYDFKDVKNLKDSVDWRDLGVVTSVKDQGQCGSCWSFAAAETIESHWAISKGYLGELSEQQILDCTANPDQCGGDGGCSGGTAELAFQNMIDMGGIASEWVYPYRSYEGDNFTCTFTNTTATFATLKSYAVLPSNEYAPLLAAINTVGPLAISVDASSWSSYETGVYNSCNQTNPDIDHAVQLVGYGTDSDLGDYWLVRNSWSAAWGEAGYIRLRRSSTEGSECGTDLTPTDGTACAGGPATVTVCGTCGILYDTSYPIID